MNDFLKHAPTMDGKLNIHEAAGTYTGGGLRSIKGAKGKLYLEAGIKNGRIDIGPEQLKEITDNHVLFCSDCGIKTASSSTVHVCKWTENGIETEYSQYDIKSDAKYRAGIDSYVSERAEEMEVFQEHRNQLRHHHGRTLDPDMYANHLQAFRQYGRPILNANCQKKNLASEAKKDHCQRRYWMSEALKALEMTRAMQIKNPGMNGAPIFIWGDPTFNPCMKGFRPASPKKMISFFSRFFFVIIVKEHMSSQRCPKCLSFLTQAHGKCNRRWTCTGDCKMDYKPRGSPNATHQIPLTWNKDVSASCNFLIIFIHLMISGKRPVAFIPRS